VFTGRLSHRKVLDLISDSDAYIITARRSYYWGGVGVALMEAMAMNVPVISPTLTHIPAPDREKLGVMIPWADTVPSTSW